MMAIEPMTVSWPRTQSPSRASTSFQASRVPERRSIGRNARA